MTKQDALDFYNQNMQAVANATGLHFSTVTRYDSFTLLPQLNLFIASNGKLKLDAQYDALIDAVIAIKKGDL